MTPFDLTARERHTAALLGVACAVGYLAITFGAEVYRCREMAMAAAEVAECQSEDECIAAYERLERLKGGR